MKRLVELEPRWVSQEGRHGQGVTFRCPVHPEGHCYQGVFFANPLDGGPPFQDEHKRNHWQRTGDTFETLTLSPSILVHDRRPDGSKTEHWHGFIRNGEVTP